MSDRFNTKKIIIGNLSIGGGSRIAIQSMLNAPAADVEKNLQQAIALEKAGCDIIRVAIPDKSSVQLVEKIKKAEESLNKAHDKYTSLKAKLDAEDRVKVLEGYTNLEYPTK